ncbi:MAG: hypothetical protein J0M35_01165 [Candidatus Obscuribacter phosphatis]|uniref:Sporulation stage II protein D amidase enhancer LytB N-terminal domain-containing protein n=1 Tax=Candidatus Obscuribacter phosphatis TaxID=1906157 RepID=A0A8J7TK21_9BACT|nr:hypothetical protein [Candidatus Obscuribacter phosphatis]
MPCFALPAQVVVKLFSAAASSKAPKVEPITLRAPFVVLSPQSIVLERGVYRLDAKDGSVQLIKNDSAKGQAIVRGRFLTMAPLGKYLHVEKGDRSRDLTGPLTARWRDGISLTARLPLVDYLAAVVGSECPPGFEPEALKALSVLVQNRLFFEQGQEGGITDDTNVMAYLGAQYARPECLAAVKKTLGYKLMEDKKLLFPYFHSTCGGKLSTIAVFDGKIKSGTVASPLICPYCKNSPFCKVHREVLSIAECKEIFSFVPLRVMQVDTARRPLRVKVASANREFELTGYELWLKLGQKLGWGFAPGLSFSFKPDGKGNLLFESIGAGHGVGLCQWGAQGQAVQGKTFAEILRYYFPQCRLVSPGRLK